MRPKWASPKNLMPPPISLGLSAQSQQSSPQSQKSSNFPNLSKIHSGRVQKSLASLFSTTRSRKKETVSEAFKRLVDSHAKNNYGQEDVYPSPTETSAASSIRSSISATAATLTDETRAEITQTITRILDKNEYLHPAFTLQYEPLYCMNISGPRVFTCAYENRFTKEKFAVKFLLKYRPPETTSAFEQMDLATEELLERDRFEIHKEVSRYLYRQDTSLPEYVVHYETDRYCAIVTKIHGNHKSSDETSVFQRIFRHDTRHLVNWNCHFSTLTQNGGSNMPPSRQ